MTMRSWLNPRAFHQRFTHRPWPPKSTNRRHPNVEALEGRVVLSWLGQVGGAGYDATTTRPVMDSAGNIYILGSFSQTVDFDAGINEAYLTSAGGEDAFVAKYSPTGSLLWARRFGGVGHDEAKGISLDTSGQYLYATGGFAAAADFTGDGLPDLTSAGGFDAFILKLDATSGTTSWEKRVGGNGDDSGSALDVGDDGFIYTSGYFRNTADFDPGPGTANLTANGKGKTPPNDIFVLRLDANGNYSSGWKVGGSSTDFANSIIVEGGSLYLLGSFQGSVDFDPGAAVVNKTSAGGSDAFFANYTTFGTLNWVRTVGGVNSEDEWRMVADANHLYITGGLTGTADFDPGTGTFNLYSDGSDDAVIIKYTKAAGSLVWANRIGGVGSDDARVNAWVDPSTGTVYVGGRFSGTVDFDPGAGTANRTSAGGWDPFVLKLDAAGNFENAWRMGSALDSESSARPIGLFNGALYVTGRFVGTADFPTGGVLTSNGDADIFLMALDQGTSQPASLMTTSAALVSSRMFLTEAHAQPVLSQAVTYRRPRGVDTLRLDPTDLVIADLSAAPLGQASFTTIALDDNSAGRGWYIGRGRKTWGRRPG